ncbi:MAG TPA: ABC transporter permease [Candidatus Acidoferrales bacterium]|nr:ABC transporter permease [Candidatus Acidoferrales bacterium]
MKRRYKLWCALALLAAFHLFVLFAGFFAPYSYSAQDRDLPYAPPIGIHFFDARGEFRVRPLVYALQDDAHAPGAYKVDKAHPYPLHFFVRGSDYKVAGLFHSSIHFFGVEAPGRIFLMGTDGYGRDQLTRFLYGGQVSLAAGLIAAGLSVILGIFVGALAGFYGGWIDEILMRGGELFLALPWLYLLFAVRAALPLHIAQWQVFLLLLAVCGIIGWARPARLIRGAVLSAKERNFVVAARTFGASDFYLLRRHVLPQTYGIILTQIALLIPQFILAEVTLTFLGLGVGEPMASWGGLLSSLQHYYVLASYWWMFVPALLLIPVFVAYYTIADELQEHLKSVPL